MFGVILKVIFRSFFLYQKIGTYTLRNNKVTHQNVKCGRDGAGGVKRRWMKRP